MAKNRVLFNKGTSESFEFIEKDPNTIYFLTDTHEIFIGDERYSSNTYWDVFEPPIPRTNYVEYAASLPFMLLRDDEQYEPTWDGLLEYSLDLETWHDLAQDLMESNIMSNEENKVYLRGTGNTVLTGAQDSYFYMRLAPAVDLEDPSKWRLAITGNVENLLDYQTVAAGGHPSMGDYCFQGVFNAYSTGMYMTGDEGRLTHAPDLPATTLSYHCYENMFSYSYLTTPPALPATTLAEGCYQNMFCYCCLTELPKLPATELPDMCYYDIFNSVFNVDDQGNYTYFTISETQSDSTPYEFRIPTSGTVTSVGENSTMIPDEIEVNTIYYCSIPTAQ